MASRNAAPRQLLSFEEVRRRLRLGTRVDAGQQEISVDHIIGSVGRAHEFDGSFRPRTKRLQRVVDQIEINRPNAADVPIVVYQVDQGYFVVDGHKRLALAMREKRIFIDAEVTRYLTRFEVDRETTIESVRSTEEELRFREATGLAAAIPKERFPLSDSDGYLDLEESVKSHAYDLSLRQGQLVSPADAARHWYETVFQPVTAAARDAGYDRMLSGCSDAERFLLMRHGNRTTFGPNWELPQSGLDRSFRNLRDATPSRAEALATKLVRRRSRRTTLLGEKERDPSAD
jgi:hypothetical protein